MQKIYVDKLYSYQTLVYKNGSRTFKKKKYLDYASEIVNQLEKLEEVDFTSAISIELGLFFKIPKSYSQKKRNALNGMYAPNKNIDVDNVSKAIIDVISRHYSFNDKVVCKLVVEKYWDSDNEFFYLNIKN